MKNVNSIYTYIIDTLYKDAFYKFFLLKDEITLLCYYPVDYLPFLDIVFLEYNDNRTLYRLSTFTIVTDLKEGVKFPYSDMIKLSENKTAFVALKWHGRRITIFILNFFENYRYYIMHKFKINIYDYKISRRTSIYSLFLKYKDLLGFAIENSEGLNGFILFGYYNSTDPKQIYNIKKDGLNYNIILSDYLNLQSNIFAYEIKGIKIVQVPNNVSGIYLISNVTRNLINNDDFFENDTEISLAFSYNGILKQGKYLFKFVGVLQEPTFEDLENFTDQIVIFNEQYKINLTEEYNERRNMNITGRVALV